MREAPYAPSNVGLKAPSARAFGRRSIRGPVLKARKKLRSAAGRNQWYIAFRRVGRDLAAGDTSGFRTIVPPVDRFYADPFLVAREGRHHLFFEDFRYELKRGLISHAEILDDGTISEPQVVLSLDYHLSYPFMFEHDGAVYMLPETMQNGTIELYRAERFPDIWRLDRVLVQGVRAVDATVLRHAGRLWMFASTAAGSQPIGSRLSIFSAERLEGPWMPHPANPVVRDVRHARPAGRIIRLGGALIRPAQDGEPRYGARIVFNRIDELNERAYRETTLGSVCPKWADAAHTIDSDEVYEVIDACRYLPRLGVRLARPTPAPVSVRPSPAPRQP